MSIETEILKLSHDELIKVNRMVVARIKDLREARNRIQIRQFRIDDSVEFWTDEGELVRGIVDKINQKTIGIITENGERWKVSPSLLQKNSKSMEFEESGQKTIDFCEEQKASNHKRSSQAEE